VVKPRNANPGPARSFPDVRSLRQPACSTRHDARRLARRDRRQRRRRWRAGCRRDCRRAARRRSTGDARSRSARGGGGSSQAAQDEACRPLYRGFGRRLDCRCVNIALQKRIDDNLGLPAFRLLSSSSASQPLSLSPKPWVLPARSVHLELIFLPKLRLVTLERRHQPRKTTKHKPRHALNAPRRLPSMFRGSCQKLPFLLQ
jgi:hypothetical protein